MAKHRLDLLGKRLTKDPDLKQMYKQSINDSLQKGYAEEVKDKDGVDGAIWYLPHHPVLNPKKPGKVRIVYDCAARYQGASLNDRIHQGPDLTNKLLGVLLKFRQEPVALNADIEGMFYQSWRRQQGSNGDDAVQTVKRNFYVEDCLKSLPTEDAAIALASELRQLLANGGFKLTKWLSNSKRVMKFIPADEWAKSVCELNLDQDDLPYERTLGVLWNAEQDCFTFDARPISRPATKRGLLSATSSVYDPLGFASPFVLKAKLLFQELCRQKLDWDAQLPEAIADQWRRWLTDLPLLSALTIPRCLRITTPGNSSEVQLHHFSDASEAAYGAISYLRVNNRCTLIMSKARLAPLNPTTIPRLKLLAAVTATDLDQHIKLHLEIPVDQTFFWTDSTNVLHYINNQERRFATFVANRIAKIQELMQRRLEYMSTC
ncbi:uncharacterized protein LOC111947899 [Oryzias latipes]|uniref:uncharacterized protein LOC111947899 n=1 Tax=Oryzias latipes TaxID=8090 RepID=UPI000CE19A9A|nr:uncharacterized protein LOC111947899 [Oryzias latipes]